MTRIRWGILATGRIARTFAGALAGALPGELPGKSERSQGHELRAVASRSRAGARAFAERFPGVTAHGHYESLLADPDIDAVYIATPHPQHVTWTLRALAAGKAVLCEKPLGLNHPEVMAMVDRAERERRFLMEAFMYRCHPQTHKLLELVRGGAIGEVRHIQASFGYHAPLDAKSRLFALEQAGGGIMDVGCYPVSMARLIAGTEPETVAAHGHIGATGIDEWASALLRFGNGVSAQVSTSVSLTLDNEVNVYGSTGRIRVTNPWHCADADGNWRFEVHRPRAAVEIVSGKADPLYVIEADHVADCLADGLLQSPRMNWADSTGNAIVLDAWRAGIGLQFEHERADRPAAPLLGPLRRAEPTPMRYGKVAGVTKPVSRLVMGCDNQPGISHAAVMWDDWFEQGGNAFDTAWLYGAGSMESLLGHWHRTRGVRDDLVIIGKGAHTPHNFPHAIAPQLTQSLERLQTDYVDLYFLHRDNPDVPAGEFIDALNEQVEAGRIHAFGGSNWSLARVQEANAYATAHGRRGFAAVSNNFSLARMVTPIWPGVEAASAPEFRRYLEESQLALLPWSAQARGFFTPWAERVRAHTAAENTIITRMQPTMAELERTWFSDDNFERRERAARLAHDRGVETINIALAWVLQQPFPCFPLIGPRLLKETRSSISALDIELSAQERRWLDLAD